MVRFPLFSSAREPARKANMHDRRRREALIAACLLGVALRVRSAEAPGKPKVALVFTTTPVGDMAPPQPRHPGARAFLEAMRASGYVETRDFIFEPRSAEGMYERYPAIFADLVKLGVDAIVTVGDDMTLQARAATPTIPIVMAYSNAPVEAGIVQSLARPGANVTGLVTNPTPEVEAKRLQLLQEAIPGLGRVAFLGLRSEWEDRLAQSVRAAARTLGITLYHVENGPNDYGGAFAAMARDRPQAIFVANSPVNFGHRNTIVALAREARLPAVYHAQEFVLAGGLMSYGLNIPDLFRGAAQIVVKLLKGARPADLPVEQPAKFDMVVNLATARELGLAIPQSVLVRTDRVIE
jgi:putative ABC transport system substrate-binding protein